MVYGRVRMWFVRDTPVRPAGVLHHRMYCTTKMERTTNLDTRYNWTELNIENICFQKGKLKERLSQREEGGRPALCSRTRKVRLPLVELDRAKGMVPVRGLSRKNEESIERRGG